MAEAPRRCRRASDNGCADFCPRCRIILQKFIQRSLIKISSEIIEESYDESTDVFDLLDKAESKLYEVTQGNIKRSSETAQSLVIQAKKRIEEIAGKEGLSGIATGFEKLDKITSGWQPSDLIIIAARPGMGKTAFSLNIAQYASVVAKVPVGYFSLEMSKEELVDRMLVSQADIDAWRLKTGKLTPGDFEKLSEAMGVLAEAPLYIDDTPGISVSQIRTKARKLQMEHDLAILIVDYLQLVDPGKRYDNRVMEVSIVSQALKNLARELKIPLLAVSQLSRAVEHRGERKPQLADLRESGAIEQDADVVMFLYRPDAEITPTIQTKLLIAKHRNGPMGEVDLIFRGDRIKFYNAEKRHESPEESK